MKKISLSILLLTATLSQAQVGFGTPIPDKSAQVDVSSTNKGFLLPRVELTTLTDSVMPITSPAEGLLIYNTKVKIDSTQTIEKGFYVWDGTSWKRFATQNELEAVSYWKPQGSGPSARGVSRALSTNPVDQDIFQKGKVGIGYVNPLDVSKNFDINKGLKKLDVYGDFRTVQDYIASNDTTYYYGIETNSIALPANYATRANVSYVSTSKSLEDYSFSDRNYRGTMFVQSLDAVNFLLRSGSLTDSTAVNRVELQYKPHQIQEIIYNSPLIASEQRVVYKHFDKNKFYVKNDKRSSSEFGIDFVHGNFYIGDNQSDDKSHYYFPNARPTTDNGQVLQYNSATNELEWKLLSSVLPTSSVVEGITTDVTNEATGNATLYKVEVKDRAITNTKLTAGTGSDGRVGIANAEGNVTYTNLNDLIQAGQKTETVSQGNGITVASTISGNVTDFSIKVTPGTAGQVLTTQTVDGTLQTQWTNLNTSATPGFFYMPSVALPVTPEMVTAMGNSNITYNTGTYSVNLHTIFSSQFNTPVIKSSTTASLNGFVLDANQYEYFVTSADASVFTITGLSESGILTYTVNQNAIVRNSSFMNIVLKVK